MESARKSNFERMEQQKSRKMSQATTAAVNELMNRAIRIHAEIYE